MASHRTSLLTSNPLNNLFRRCVVNCPTEFPECPECPEGETCSYTTQTCDQCADSICVPDPAAKSGSGDSDDSDDGGGSGSNAGAIAGGVVGGVALLVIVALVFWFFRRRQRAANDRWNPSQLEKRNDNYTADQQQQQQQQQRARRSRVGSMASTVLTRASNVIQIAYIPGVTNRSPPDSPAVLVPPVPPIPSGASGQTNEQDQHYFLPGDIRDSVWSEMTEDQRKSISPSLARSSVATTIYRNNAIVSPVPAQQAMRAKPAMVSVKSGQNSPASTPGVQTPAVPTITSSQIDKANAVGAQLDAKNQTPTGSSSGNSNGMGSSIVARSGVAKPVNVTKPRNMSSTPADPKSPVPTVTVEDVSDTDLDHTSDKQVVSSPSDSSSYHNSNNNEQSKGKDKQRESSQSVSGTVIEDSPAVKQSPFADPTPSPSPQGQSTAIPEEMSISSQQPVSAVSDDSRRGSTTNHRHRASAGRLSQITKSSGERSMSPFGDENEVKYTTPQ